MGNILSELANRPAAAAQPVQMAAAHPQLALLELLDQDQLTSETDLSPRMVGTARGFNYEPVGGRRVRCLNCPDERVYNAKRLKQHRCPPQ